MSLQWEQTFQEAYARNLSPAATHEWLADMELETKQGRAIERRFTFITTKVERTCRSPCHFCPKWIQSRSDHLTAMQTGTWAQFA